MVAPKAKTLQQRFGFKDYDLVSPDHDTIMIWLNDNIVEILNEYTGKNANAENTKTRWECVVLDKGYNKKYTVGFVDMLAIVDQVYVYMFEVKTKIPSLGELIRQVRMYQTYTNEDKFYVVSPDDRFMEQIESQGIGFIKYEPDRYIK